MRSIISMLLLLLVSPGLTAQEISTVTPGKLYDAGEEVYAPTYGFKATIPQGWTGMLPQGTELFMLMKEDGTSGEVVMAARENSNLTTLEEAWKTGAPLTDAIYLKASADFEKEGEMIYSEVEGEGDHINKGYRGLIIGKCSSYGPCISLLMISPSQFFDGIKAEMLDLMRSSTFSEPMEVNPYTQFDWQRFLANKVMVAYLQEGGGKRQNELDLCVDGTFTANIKRSGWLKDEAGRYVGKQKGTWTVSGNGPETTLTLEFERKNLEPLEVQLKIEDEKVYANGTRHYAGYSQKCR